MCMCMCVCIDTQYMFDVLVRVGGVWFCFVHTCTGIIICTVHVHVAASLCGLRPSKMYVCIHVSHKSCKCVLSFQWPGFWICTRFVGLRWPIGHLGGGCYIVGSVIRAGLNLNLINIRMSVSRVSDCMSVSNDEPLICTPWTAILSITEGQFQASHRFSSTKLVLKTVES